MRTGSATDLDAVRQRLEACLLAGAMGDALGSGLEFETLAGIRARWGSEGPDAFVPAYGRLGAVTDDTQMTLFTAEGLIRARTRALREGLCHTPSVVRRAYLRWLGLQEPASTASDPALRDGWLVHEEFLHHRRAPGSTCITGLRDPRLGSVESPLNDSKGCGGVMRMAPAAAVHFHGMDAFQVGRDLAALTHGHPTGYLAAGVLAETVAWLLEGDALPAALARARERLRREPRHAETEAALERAVALATGGRPPSPEAVESLGAGWVAEEALAIGVYCALVAPTLRAGLRLAVTHSGDSDSTGSIAGNLLGASRGPSALPGDLLAGLEGAGTIRAVARDLHAHLIAQEPGIEERDAQRYPGS